MDIYGIDRFLAQAYFILTRILPIANKKFLPKKGMTFYLAMIEE